MQLQPCSAFPTGITVLSFHPIPGLPVRSTHDAYHPVCLENQKYQYDGIKHKEAKKKKKKDQAFRIQETNLSVRVSG